VELGYTHPIRWQRKQHRQLERRQTPAEIIEKVRANQAKAARALRKGPEIKGVKTVEAFPEGASATHSHERNATNQKPSRSSSGCIQRRIDERNHRGHVALFVKHNLA